MTVIRISRWDEFRETAVKLGVKTIIYGTRSAPLAKPPIGLRIFFATDGRTYVFTDSAVGPELRKTGIPIQDHDKQTAGVDEEAVKRFLRAQLGEDIEAISADILLG